MKKDFFSIESVYHNVVKMRLPELVAKGFKKNYHNRDLFYKTYLPQNTFRSNNHSFRKKFLTTAGRILPTINTTGISTNRTISNPWTAIFPGKNSSALSS